MDEDDGGGGLDGGEVGAGGDGLGGGGGERGWVGGRKVVISQLLINIPRLRAFQRNVIN